MWRFGLTLAFLRATTFALIFPLPPTPSGEYDSNFHVLRSFSEVWRTNHHAVINLASQNAVAIAPFWLLTAWHVARNLDETWYANDDTTRYYLRDKIDLGNDLALIRVDKPFRSYSRLQRFPAGADDIVTVYGQSAAPLEPIFDSMGKPSGWKFGPFTNHPALRWGKGRLLPRPTGALQWDFTNRDPELGLSCAGVNTNDSGGGIFVRDALVGITTELTAENFRWSKDEPVDPECELHAIGHLYDPSNFYRCTSDLLHPITRANGSPIYPALAKIYQTIAPSIAIHAGEGFLTKNGKDWKPELRCTNCQISVDTSTEPVDVSGLLDPAPQMVYQSAAFVSGSPASTIQIAIADQLKYESYNVRLHFASIFPAQKPGVCLQSVTVNGRTRLIDPYSASRKASIITFEEIYPDEQNSIHLTVKPQNNAGNALICGVEVDVTPLAPAAIAPLKIDTTLTYGIEHEKAVHSAQSAADATAWRPHLATRGALTVLAGPSASLLFPLIVSTNSGATVSALALPPESAALFAVKYDQSQFLAVGERGQILHSGDGLQWAKSQNTGTNDLYALSFGNSTWVAVGANGAIAVSSDGHRFSVANSGTTAPLHAVTFGSSGFVAVGAAGTAMRSLDGHTWERFKVVDADLFGITYGDRTYLAVGTNGIALVSQDGANWTPSRPTSATLRDVDFADGLFMALEVTQPPNASVAHFTTDGIAWTAVPLPPSLIAMNASEDSFWVVGQGTSTSFVGRLRLRNPEIRMHGTTGPNGVLTLTFDAPLAGKYQVLSTPAPGQAAWETNAVLERNGSDQMTWSGRTPPDPVRFYRIEFP